MNISHYILLILLLTYSSNIVAQSSFETQIDSMFKVLENTSNTTERVDILNEISYKCRRFNPEKVIRYAKEAQQLAVETNYTKGESIAYKNMGIGHYKLGSSKDSIVGFYEKSIEKAKIIKDHDTEVACMNNIALVYKDNLEFHTGIQYLLKAIDLYDKHHKKANRLKGLMVGNVGFIYFKLEEYEKALKYQEQAIRISRENNIEIIRSIFLDDLGETLIKLNRLDKAEDILNEALEIQKKLGDVQSTIQAMLYKIELTVKRKQYDKAALYGEEILNMPQSQKFPTLLINTLSKLAKISFLLKEYNKTIQYSQQVIEGAKGSVLLTYQKESLQYLYKAYGKKKMYAEAYKASQDFIQLTDSLRNFNKAEYTADLEAKYQNKQQAQKIEYLNEQQGSQNTIIHLLIGLIAITFVSIGLISYLYMKRRQSSNIIEKKNLELNQYIKHNLELENFAYITSHDLQTPIRTIVSFSQLLKRKSKNKLDKTDVNYLDFIIKGAKEISLLINDLLNYTQIQGRPIQVETIVPKTLVESALESFQSLIQAKNVVVELDLHPKSIKGDPLKLKTALQHLISNALKFHESDENIHLTIKLLEEDKHWTFLIQDNGMGIKETYYDRIFLIFKKLHRKEDYEGTGIGLAICKKIAEQHNGNIWVDSTIDKGSTFFMTIDREYVNKV